MKNNKLSERTEACFIGKDEYSRRKRVSDFTEKEIVDNKAFKRL